jgi:hypothetical protein
VKRGRRLAKPSARGCAYGFDARGRVVVDRQPRSDEPAFDEFFTYGKAAVESAAYRRDGGHALHYVTRQTLRGGRPVRTDVLDADGRSSYRETYRYRAGRLCAIDVVSREGADEQAVKYDLVYEPDGRLRAIRRHFEYLPHPYPVYWNPASAETLESLTKAMHATLLKLIPAAVARAKIREPAYCLAISHDGSEDELPPDIAVGLESERQRFLASGKDAKAALWDATRFATFRRRAVKLDAPGLAEASEKLLQMVLMKEALHVPGKVLNDVAAELNRRSWKGILRTTDDFIVYATDVDGMELKKDLKAAVPKAKLDLLRSRRLL